jgi:hypothetical protein
VSGASEDRAGAVFHQDEVGDVYRQLPGRIERMHGLDAGIEALLFSGVDHLLRGALTLNVGDKFREFWIGLGSRDRQRMIRCDRHELGTEQRIGTRGENFQVPEITQEQISVSFDLCRRVALSRQLETNEQAFRAADPIVLHEPDFLRPAIQLLQRVEQVLRIFGDLEEPLGQLALLDNGARAPAAAVDHLLIGEHGVIHGIPVHLRLLALDQAGGEKVREHLLLMFVVAGVAGREFARPVERQTHGLQLLLHRSDVLIGPGLRRHFALDGGVLRRKAECVPAHGMEDVEPLGALQPGQHVAHGVVAHMAHMDAPRRIGEHLKHVIFRPRVVVLGGEDRLVVPHALPARFGFAGVVAFVRHRFGSLFRGL